MADTDDQLHNTFRDTNDSLLYFHPDYLHAQQYFHLKVLQSANYFSCFAIEDHTAKSLPNSPFGGIFSEKASLQGFLQFWQESEAQLRAAGVRNVLITQPPEFYTSFVPAEWLESAGFSRGLSETHQYLPIQGQLYERLHLMEKRKLKNYDDFEISISNDVEAVHKFIADCRIARRLNINITLDKLCTLIGSFPERYKIFIAEKSGQLAAAVITTMPVKGVAYYYLPATNPKLKHLSPMVSLVKEIYEYYQKKGFSIIDMGISSIDGKLQESLFQFKKRMGAKSTFRTAWYKSIQ